MLCIRLCWRCVHYWRDSLSPRLSLLHAGLRRPFCFLSKWTVSQVDKPAGFPFFSLFYPKEKFVFGVFHRVGRMRDVSSLPFFLFLFSAPLLLNRRRPAMRLSARSNTPSSAWPCLPSTEPRLSCTSLLGCCATRAGHSAGITSATSKTATARGQGRCLFRRGQSSSCGSRERSYGAGTRPEKQSLSTQCLPLLLPPLSRPCPSSPLTRTQPS